MSQLRHAASKVCQDNASGVEVDEIGVIRDQELTDAMHDMIDPTKMCSGAICSSQMVGVAHS